jgi:glycosyltransferase involved in cell wall biosynthesis
VLACSEDDARDIAARCGIAAAVVPNAVRIPDGDAVTSSRYDLLFLGNFNYAPNVEAAQWLCREILPRLPGATLALVGHSPSAALQDLAQQGRVLVSGTVSDVGPFYRGARLVVVPLHAGGGTSIKVLEALARRRPVVSTTVGVRGIPVTNGEHVLGR